MRTGAQWRHLQQLGRAFTANLCAPASYEANLINSTFVSWSKPVEQQIWKSSKSLVHWVEQENKSAIGWSSTRGHARQFSSISNQELGGQSSVLTPNSRYAGPINPKLFSFNPSQGWKLLSKLTSVRTRVSNASSREPEYWDAPETSTPPSQSGQEGLQADQIRVPREREWDHDENEDLARDRKVRKEVGHVKMGKDDDGVEWGQQHVRLREYETRQRASLSPNPSPQFQKDDVYIPVKACYISRR